MAVFRRRMNEFNCGGKKLLRRSNFMGSKTQHLLASAYCLAKTCLHEHIAMLAFFQQKPVPFYRRPFIKAKRNLAAFIDYLS